MWCTVSKGNCKRIRTNQIKWSFLSKCWGVRKSFHSFIFFNCSSFLKRKYSRTQFRKLWLPSNTKRTQLNSFCSFTQKEFSYQTESMESCHRPFIRWVRKRDVHTCTADPVKSLAGCLHHKTSFTSISERLRRIFFCFVDSLVESAEVFCGEVLFALVELCEDVLSELVSISSTDWIAFVNERIASFASWDAMSSSSVSASEKRGTSSEASDWASDSPLTLPRWLPSDLVVVRSLWTDFWIMSAHRLSFFRIPSWGPVRKSSKFITAGTCGRNTRFCNPVKTHSMRSAP